MIYSAQVKTRLQMSNQVYALAMANSLSLLDSDLWVEVVAGRIIYYVSKPSDGWSHDDEHTHNYANLETYI